MAAQAHEGEEAVRLSVFRFAIGKAGQPSKPPPVRRAGVSVVPLRQCLRGQASEVISLDVGIELIGYLLKRTHEVISSAFGSPRNG
jgi:hypothetical protein